jgi:hypothetical protein
LPDTSNEYRNDEFIRCGSGKLYGAEGPMDLQMYNERPHHSPDRLFVGALFLALVLR